MTLDYLTLSRWQIVTENSVVTTNFKFFCWCYYSVLTLLSPHII